MAKELPTGRIRRAAKVGRLAGGQTARGYATKAANLTRDEEARHAAAGRRQMEAAEQIFDVLGQMKGAAMKVGQVASFMDTGTFPPEFQDRIQAKLAELRDAAPRVPFEKMRKVVEDDLGEPLDQLFAEFAEEAVAAASIGQVYRARLHDGRDVAVKVQYPGVAQAVRADLQNLGLIMRVAKRIAPGMDAKAMTKEIRERLTDELDYEHEAQQHRAFARTWRGHPSSTCRRWSPTSAPSTCWSPNGWTARASRRCGRWTAPPATASARSSSASSSGRSTATVTSPATPIPGNYRLMPDGRVAFMDFGMTKRVSREDIDAEVGAIRAAMDGDAEELHRRLGAMGFFDPSDDLLPADAVYEHFHDVTAWYIEDREVTIDRALVAQILIDFGDPRSRHWQLMKRETMPPQSMLARRMEALTLGVLGQLEATANWHRIGREWLFGDPASTELGAAEEPFHLRAAA